MIGLLFTLLSSVRAEDCTVLRYASDHPESPSGQTRTAVVMRGERITTPGVVVDHGCVELILPDGAVIAPAFIHADASLGLTEVSLEPFTNDSSLSTDDPIRAAFSLVDAYNPRSSLIPITRIEGIGSVVVMPRGGLVAGQAAAFDLTGESQAQALIAPSVSMVANVSGGEGSRAGRLLRLRELLDDARTFRDNQVAWRRSQLHDLSATGLDLAAMNGVLSGQQPLVIGANRASEIEAVLRFAKEQRVGLVITGGAEAWLLADEIAQAEVAVMLDPLQVGVRGFDSLHARPDNAALLEAAGVKVVIITEGGHNARKLRQTAGNAVREGMSHAGAMDAITANPAEVFGLLAHGRITPGAMANVVVWSGDPLEISSAPLHIWIRGKSIPLRSRQTELMERYRTVGEVESN